MQMSSLLQAAIEEPSNLKSHLLRQVKTLPLLFTQHLLQISLKIKYGCNNY